MSVRKLSPQSTAFVVTFWLPCRGDVKTCTAVVASYARRFRCSSAKRNGAVSRIRDYKLSCHCKRCRHDDFNKDVLQVREVDRSSTP
jgi:hypothetical protein